MEQGIFEVEVTVKETRLYRIKANSIEDAESEALDMAENGTDGDELVETEFFPGNPYISDSRDVTEDARDYDAENDRDRDEAGK